MKKCLFLMFCLFISIKGVYALTSNDNGINLDNSIITQEKYEELIGKYGKRKIDTIYNYDTNMIKLLASDTANRESVSKYVITTYKLDSDGNIIGENSIETTKENAIMVANNDYLIVDDMGNIVNYLLIQNRWDVSYSTTSKAIHMDYIYEPYPSDPGYQIHIYVEWFKMPKIRDFDVTAAMWANSVSTSTLNFLGTQDGSGSDYQIYNKQDTPNNYVQSSHGLGVSMNLFNNSTSLEIELFIFSPSAFGSINGTYQHAINTATTLAISKSYSFNSSGLGGVLLYSNSTYSSYYDGMGGVSI